MHRSALWRAVRPRQSLSPLVLSHCTSIVRGHCAPARAPPEPAVQIYRLSFVKELRLLLRMKVLQLGVGVGVLLPAGSFIGSGAQMGAAEFGALGAVVVGTIGAGSTMSWYCERLAGEITWRPLQQALRVSTLTMWGHRRDRDYTAAELLELGYRAPDAADADEEGESWPLRDGGASLDLGERSFLLHLHRRHVRDALAVSRLLDGQLPRDLAPSSAATPREDGRRSHATS